MSVDVGETPILSGTAIRMRLLLGRGFAGKEFSDDGSNIVIGCRLIIGLGWFKAAKAKASTRTPTRR
jgi:hypothetical protein